MQMATGAQHRCLELVKAPFTTCTLQRPFASNCVDTLFTSAGTNGFLFAQSFASASCLPGTQDYSFASFIFLCVSIQNSLVTHSDVIDNILGLFHNRRKSGKYSKWAVLTQTENCSLKLRQCFIDKYKCRNQDVVQHEELWKQEAILQEITRTLKPVKANLPPPFWGDPRIEGAFVRHHQLLNLYNFRQKSSQVSSVQRQVPCVHFLSLLIAKLSRRILTEEMRYLNAL